MKTLSIILLSALLLFAVPAFAEPVDINTANAVTLVKSMKGIGPAKAEAIVAYREANGPFRSVHDLTRVKGVGKKTVEDNIDLITVKSPAKQQ